MENNEFQKLVLENFEDIKEKLTQHDLRFVDIKTLSDQHHQQIEELILGQKNLQEDIDYFLLRALRSV
ncbi:MAG TPA: hypothetical protein VIM42_06380 [Clostridium sp.]